jgi:HAD superfamily hydrolase (TIGR01509 family)
VNGVVFDFDGVLADSEPLSWDAWRSVLGDAGIEVSSEDVAVCTGTTSRTTYRHFARYGQLPPYEEVLAAVDGYRRSRYPTDLNSFPDAVDTVRTLAMHGVPLAIASSSSRRNLDLKLEILGLDRYFEVTVAGDEVTHGKPAPDLYAAAVAGLGIDPTGSIAVEDTAIGADAAAAAGLRTVIVDRAGLASDKHPTVSELSPELLLLWLGRS